ncbi:MAG: DUF6680 family protein [Pseudodesulfovibrio sp.]|uniref:DUF6680 family protein n=1 Tax=Pseudodesulfovibrio sp. TaxID=2035812 RepID=UPI003D0C06BF
MEWISVLAILIGPVAAVLVGRSLQDRKHKMDRKDLVFKNLMSTRKMSLHPDHVRALNMIDIEFASNRKEEVKVRDAWKRYSDHLSDEKFRLQDLDGWARKGDDLLCNLLEKLAQALGYPIQRSQIEKGSYSPQFYLDNDAESQILRRGLIRLVHGELALKVSPFTPDPEPVTTSTDLNDINGESD